MAMTDGAIAKARAAAGTIGQKAGNLQSAGESLNDTMSRDIRYQYFKAGTDRGASVDADVKKTVDAIVDMLSPKLSQAQSLIMSCCDAAEIENRIRRQQEAEAAKAAENTIIPNGIKGIGLGAEEIVNRPSTNYNGELEF